MMLAHLILSLLTAHLATSVLPAMTSPPLNKVQQIANISYYLSDAVAYVGPECPSAPGPCTIIPFADAFTTEQIERTIATFASQDDVWSPSYLDTVILIRSPPDPQLGEDVLTIIRTWGAENIYFTGSISGEHPLPWGPYWLENRHVHKVSRLYSDDVDAFVVSTVQNGNDHYEYRPLVVGVDGVYNPASLSIAVPSRLYYKRSGSLPLAGLRIAVKDNTDLRGVRTGGSSRSYTRLYGPSNETAPAVQILLEMGAVIVGKTKTTQFADTEWATGDWVDFHAPFSPRADGYQSPSGSSAGSGAAIAAFDWLDFATGTDGCGSLRSPAAVEGLFAMRPSHGAVSVDRIIPWGSELDTFGGFARDVGTLDIISKALYASHGSDMCPAKPKRILYPTEFWPVRQEEQQMVFKDFIAKLEIYLGVECKSISLDEIWKKSNPVGSDKSLAEYFNNTLPWAYAPTQHQTYKLFQDDYVKTFGRTPYFNPEGQYKMKWLLTVTSEMHDQALMEMSIFKDWFESNIIPASTDGGSGALLLIPWTTGIPDYRDVYRSKPNWVGSGWFYYMVAPFAKAPEIIVPVGQTRYASRVSNREEWLPASLGIVGARGSDVTLPALLRDMMETMQLQTSVHVGQTAFSTTSAYNTERPLVQVALG